MSTPPYAASPFFISTTLLLRSLRAVRAVFAHGGAVRSGTFTGLHQAKGSELALQVIGKHQLGR